MPYYGDHLAGDPGLFSFVKKIKLGRVLGGLVRSVPGAQGVLSTVNAIRQAAGAQVAPRPATPAPAPVVQVAAPLPTLAPGTRQVTLVGRRRRRRVSTFAARAAAARRARLQRLGYRV